MKTLKQFGTMTILLIMVTGGLSQAVAQPYYCTWDDWNSGVGLSWWNNDIPEKYALNAKQITQMNEARRKYNEMIATHELELDKLSMEYQKFSSSSDPDMKKMRSTRKQMRSLEAKIEDLQMDAWSEINQHLTKKQKTYLKSGGFGWWDNDTSWWCHDNYNWNTKNEMGKYVEHLGKRITRGHNNKYCW